MHTLLLMVRAGLFFAWVLCGCVWLNRRFSLPAAHAPLVFICGVSLAVYAAGLLNIIWPVQLALYLAPPVLAARYIWREKGQALRPLVSLSMALFLAAAAATLLAERGRVIDNHDELAHWAIAAKTMITTGRLPNMADTAVQFVDYPPAATLWIKAVCGLTGFSDGSMLFAQSFLFLAAVLAFAPLCQKRWYAGAAVLGYALYMAALSVAYRELRVDGMLTMLTAAVWAITAALRKEPRRALAASLPVLCFLAILKNSGLFFVALGAIPLMALVARNKPRGWKTAGLATLPLAGPLFTWWLWQAHVALVFVDADSAKHTASLTAYAGQLAGKTPEDIAAFWEKFRGFWLFISDPPVMRLYACAAVFLLTVLALAALGRMRWRAAAGYAAAGTAATAAYVAALAATYLFSMNTDEMLAIASIRRYAASWFECLPAAAIILALVYLEPALEEAGRLRGLVPAGARPWQAFALCAALALFGFGFAAAHGQPANLLYSARAASASARQNYWLELKEEYGLPEGESCLLYVSGMNVDSWHEGYVVRYVFNSGEVVFTSELSEELARQYDFLVVCAQDEGSRAFLESLGLDPNAVLVDLRHQW